MGWAGGGWVGGQRPGRERGLARPASAAGYVWADEQPRRGLQHTRSPHPHLHGVHAHEQPLPAEQLVGQAAKRKHVAGLGQPPGGEQLGGGVRDRAAARAECQGGRAGEARACGEIGSAPAPAAGTLTSRQAAALHAGAWHRTLVQALQRAAGSRRSALTASKKTERTKGGTVLTRSRCPRATRSLAARGTGRSRPAAEVARVEGQGQAGGCPSAGARRTLHGVPPTAAPHLAEPAAES